MFVFNLFLCFVDLYVGCVWVRCVHFSQKLLLVDAQEWLIYKQPVSIGHQKDVILKPLGNIFSWNFIFLTDRVTLFIITLK